MSKFSNYESAGAAVWADVNGGGPGNTVRVATCHSPGFEDARNAVSAHAHARLFAAAPTMFEYMSEGARNGDAYCQTILKQYALKWD